MAMPQLVRLYLGDDGLSAVSSEGQLRRSDAGAHQHRRKHA